MIRYGNAPGISLGKGEDFFFGGSIGVNQQEVAYYIYIYISHVYCFWKRQGETIFLWKFFWNRQEVTIDTVYGSEIPNNYLGCRKPSK